MKIATWNINSIRRRLPLLTEWLAVHNPDVLCLQETKVQDGNFPVEAIRSAGYHVTYRGKTGFNGVATITRELPERVVKGFTAGTGDEDDRLLLTITGGVAVVNTYVPQGFKIDSDKYVYKLEWLQRLRRFFKEHLDPSGPALWVGDMNVAPEPIDVYHPERRVNDVDFHSDARNGFKEARSWGFEDVFRNLHPDRVQYTYWDYFRNAFGNNWGWRIDHILATAPLARVCRAADVDLAPRQSPIASDHTIAWAEFDRV